MHRVELKGLHNKFLFFFLDEFLMHRVELKDSLVLAQVLEFVCS